jgi:hypothetical protein
MLIVFQALISQNKVKQQDEEDSHATTVNLDNKLDEYRTVVGDDLLSLQLTATAEQVVRLNGRQDSFIDSFNNASTDDGRIEALAGLFDDTPDSPFDGSDIVAWNLFFGLDDDEQLGLLVPASEDSSTVMWQVSVIRTCLNINHKAS